MNKTRKAIIYGGIILISACLVFLIISQTVLNASTTTTSTTTATDTATTIADGIPLDSVKACSVKSVTDPETGAVTESLVNSSGEECSCDEGNPPGGVAASVTSAKSSAEAVAATTGSSITTAITPVKTDFETGSVSLALKAFSSKVYSSDAEAWSAFSSLMNSSLVPAAQSKFFDPADLTLTTKTQATSDKSKSFFNTTYSTDLNKWGPQVTFDTSFLKSGNLSLSARTKIGEIKYNGVSTDLGYANTSFIGKWQIAGSNLSAVAAYDCNIGSATGATSVTGDLRFAGFTTEVPFLKLNGLGQTVKTSLKLSYNFVNKSHPLSVSLGWHF